MSTIIVKNSEGLVAALNSARSGDTIKLAAGDYAAVQLKGLHFAGAGVTVTSLDPANEAKLTGLMLRDSDGLNFKGLEFVVNPEVANPYQVLDSARVNFDNINVHGTLDKNPEGDGSGLLIRRSDGVTVTNSEFHDLKHGVTHADSNNILVNGNQFHHIQTDGVRGGGTSNITVSNNAFTDFRPEAGNHPDAIQFWTTNTTASATDIKVTGNVIVRGSGDPIQGIFFRDQVEGLPFKNVTISDNLVIGGAFNGIHVNGAENVVLTNNTVAGLPDQKSWIGLESITGAVLNGNRSTQYFVDDTVSGLTKTSDTVITAPLDGGQTLLSAYLTSHTLMATISSNLLSGRADAAIQVMEFVRQAAVVVTGTAGADTLLVDALRDTRIEAGAGSDLLTGGGVGHNTLDGGAGDDTYRVRSAMDTVVEGANGGDDLVLASVDFVLSDNVERLTLTGDARKGSGNALDNRISGGAGDDILSGLGGDDYIQGQDGNDKILGGDGADALYGNAGHDTLQGGVGDDKLRGDAGNDSLAGGDGADTLDGSVGADILSGGLGADMFTFRDGELAATGETITDFNRAQGDVVYLSPVDANTNMAGDQKFAFIGTSAFSKTAGQLRYEVTGRDAILMGDVNGDGLADFKVLLQGVSSFQVSDFLL